MEKRSGGYTTMARGAAAKASAILSPDERSGEWKARLFLTLCAGRTASKNGKDNTSRQRRETSRAHEAGHASSKAAEGEASRAAIDTGECVEAIGCFESAAQSLGL